jgi:hypothetical protein
MIADAIRIIPIHFCLNCVHRFPDLFLVLIRGPTEKSKETKPANLRLFNYDRKSGYDARRSCQIVLRFETNLWMGPSPRTPEVGRATQHAVFAQIPVRSNSLWYNGARTGWAIRKLSAADFALRRK